MWSNHKVITASLALLCKEIISDLHEGWEVVVDPPVLWGGVASLQRLEIGLLSNFLNLNRPLHLKQSLFVGVREAGGREVGDDDVVDDEVGPVPHPHGDWGVVGDGEEVSFDGQVLKYHISHILHCKVRFPHLAPSRDEGKPVVVINFVGEQQNVLDGFPDHV